jgi:hypothetical protein
MWKLGLRPQFPEKEYINGIFVAVWYVISYKYPKPQNKPNSEL